MCEYKFCGVFVTLFVRTLLLRRARVFAIHPGRLSLWTSRRGVASAFTSRAFTSEITMA